MSALVLAATVFVALHLLVSGTRLRDRLVARIGERAYLAAFSLASIAGLWWLIVAYGDVHAPLPSPLRAWLPLAWLLAVPATILVVLGLVTRSPTAVGGERALDLPPEQQVRGIHRITRHPFLWGVAVWAAVHMLFNAEPASLLFFGTFLVLALVGPRLIDGKRARRHGDRWARYAAVTSNLPFAAIAQGRNRLVASELGGWPLLLSLAVLVALVLLHGRLFGIPVT